MTEEPCIYFLKRAGKIVYIGQTKNVTARIPMHRASKKFDEVEKIPCSFANLNRLERKLIKKHQPEYNKMAGGTVGRNPIQKTCSVCGTGFSTERDWARFCSRKCQRQAHYKPSIVNVDQIVSDDDNKDERR